MDQQLMQFALDKLTSQFNGILACLDPKRIVTYEYGLDKVGYWLDTEHLQPEDIVLSWTWCDRKLERCSAEQYLKSRTTAEGVDHVEFSFSVRESIALVVWICQNDKIPIASCGGTDILQKVEGQWTKIPDAGSLWWS